MESSSDKKYMKAVIMNGPSNWEYRNDLKEIPVPRKGEVLIKVEATVINPSDTYFMRGFYSGEFSYPLIPGSEGSGTVISSGGGLMGWSIVGKRVAFVKPTERPGKYSRDGAYAEYIVANAMMCVTLPNNMSFE
jgi:NADPH:quinone reductase-like Zn-dependent oxidoreductase